MNSIFSYTDYRKYLFDYYTEGKHAGVTYRQIAIAVGFKSPGHFTQIIKGQADISDSLTQKFARYCKLKPREAAYFTTLVQFNQSGDSAVKKAHFERLASFKKSSVRIVDPDQYEFYNKWYYSPLRELLDIMEFRDDHTTLASMLIPAITPAQAKRAIVLLEHLGLIIKGSDGIWRKTDQVISTGTGASSPAINNFAITSMDMAKMALANISRDERTISWMTLTVSPASFCKIQEELRAFRQKALEIARADNAPDQVYQFNFQLFPLSRRLEKKSSS